MKRILVALVAGLALSVISVMPAAAATNGPPDRPCVVCW